MTTKSLVIVTFTSENKIDFFFKTALLDMPDIDYLIVKKLKSSESNSLIPFTSELTESKLNYVECIDTSASEENNNLFAYKFALSSIEQGNQYNFIMFVDLKAFGPFVPRYFDKNNLHWAYCFFHGLIDNPNVKLVCSNMTLKKESGIIKPVISSYAFAIHYEDLNMINESSSVDQLTELFLTKYNHPNSIQTLLVTHEDINFHSQNSMRTLEDWQLKSTSPLETIFYLPNVNDNESNENNQQFIDHIMIRMSQSLDEPLNLRQNRQQQNQQRNPIDQQDSYENQIFFIIILVAMILFFILATIFFVLWLKKK